MSRHNSITDNNGEIREILIENLFDVLQSDNGSSYYDLSQNLSIDGDISPEFYYEHSYVGENWHVLSNRYYSTPELYWAILVVNQITNPFDKPENGTIIKIPTISFVRSLVTLINDESISFSDEA